MLNFTYYKLQLKKLTLNKSVKSIFFLRLNTCKQKLAILTGAETTGVKLTNMYMSKVA